MSPIIFLSSMEGCPWGGSEELWSQAALRLASTGEPVAASVAYSDKPRPALQHLQDEGVTTHCRQKSRSLWERARSKITRTTHNGLCAADVRWLLAQKPRMVCISQGGIADGLPWMLFCREHAIPYMTVVQSNAEWLWPDDDTAALMAQAYASARLCCFVSERNRELVEDQIAEPLPNACLVHNPVNVPWDAAPAWPAQDPAWKLACVARLDPVAKGQDLLVRVMALDKWKSRNLKVRFYGTGRCAQGLRKLATRFGATGAEFMGHAGDVPAIWADNHALVLPSRYEGTPLALVEAMLCKRIGIVTDVAGNANLIEDGVSGFVARAPTLGLLDNALERAWNRRTEWETMGTAARLRIETSFPRDPVEAFCNRLLRSTVLP